MKIFAGPVWEERLLEFVGVFTKRREEFEFALTIHTTIGVDTANQRIAELTRRQVTSPLYTPSHDGLVDNLD